MIAGIPFGRLIASYLMVSVLLTFWMQPGPWQAFVPSRIGLVEIAPGIYTETEARKTAVMAQVREGRNRLAVLWPRPISAPRIVLCGARHCWDRMGAPEGFLGYALFDWLIVASPRGLLNGDVVGHELAHAEIHAHFRKAGFLLSPLPVWFEEGLAIIVGGENDYPLPTSQEDVRLAVDQGAGRNWTVKPVPLVRVGASALIVEKAVERVGWRGIGRLLDRVTEGVSFEEAWREEIGVSPSGLLAFDLR